MLLTSFIDNADECGRERRRRVEASLGALSLAANLVESCDHLVTIFNDMNERIREVIRVHGRLPVDPETLADDADLYAAGMTSHASVSVMLALEEAFDVEFPDRMLTRSVFSSVSSVAGALTELQADVAA